MDSLPCTSPLLRVEISSENCTNDKRKSHASIHFPKSQNDIAWVSHSEMGMQHEFLNVMTSSQQKSQLVVAQCKDEPHKYPMPLTTDQNTLTIVWSPHVFASTTVPAHLQYSLGRMLPYKEEDVPASLRLTLTLLDVHVPSSPLRDERIFVLQESQKCTSHINFMTNHFSSGV